MTQGTTLASYEGRNRKFVGQRTAILLVDVQNAEVTDEVKDSHPFFFEQVQTRALPNMKRLIDGARASGAEIIYTVIESLTKDGRDRSLDYKLSNMHVPRGSPLAKVIDAVAPEDDDIVLPKTSSGVFNSTNIDYVLRNLGVEFVVVAGFVTDQCIDMAIRDGADRGYYMVCAQDACAAYSQERHDMALRAFGGYCVTLDVDQILANFA